ncbi:hypothetical protein PG999_009947 [Apiospora kogelbergensis]|uniref:F-box domain-containing protein n=2 Tax=Apiospora kogelbergensis TaxID=1337665 RepID=A0AAW0QPV8_9PEZI
MSGQVVVSRCCGLATVDTKKATAVFLPLPPELLNMVYSYFEDRATLSSLTQVSKSFRAEWLPRLYRHRINAESVNDLPKLFRSFGPLLSSYVKKRLEKGLNLKQVRATRSSVSSDEDKKKPTAAYHVQNLRLHVAPRASIQYGQYSKTQWEDVCHYIEAAIEALPNLKAVETNVITEPIASHLSSSLCLEALTIPCVIDGDFKTPEEEVQRILECINFEVLRRLSVASPYGRLLFPRLSSGSNAGISPALETLKVTLTQETETMLEFIATFDTLRSLTIRDCRPYTHETEQGNVFLPAILKHKKLRTLRIRFVDKDRDLQGVPLSNLAVHDIVNGLPELRRLDFGPSTWDLMKIGSELARSKNLESVTCLYHSVYPYIGQGASSEVVKEFERGFFDNRPDHRKLQLFVSCASDISLK